MAVKELNIDLNPSHPHIIIKGRRDVLSKNVEGNWATLFKGSGMEFTGFRAYSYSDDASMIDWRASLRSKSLLVREFEEFKNFNVYFLFDTSNNMLFSSEKLMKAEFGAHILYSLANEALEAGDAIGMGMFNNGIIDNIMPSFGKGMLQRISSSLVNKENYGGKRDFSKSMLQISSLLGMRSVILLISDFIGLPEDWKKLLELLSKRHQVIGVMIRDKRDKKLPLGGQFYLKDPNSDEGIYVDVKKFAKEYAEIMRKDEEKIVRTFKKLRSDCLVLDNDDPKFLDKIRKFFNRLYHLEV